MANTDFPTITLADKLEFGFLTKAEVAALKSCGLSAINRDLKSGVLPYEKHGRSVRIPGPAAKVYKPTSRKVGDTQVAA